MKMQRLKSLNQGTSQIKTNEEYQALIRGRRCKRTKTKEEDALLVVLEKAEDVKKKSSMTRNRR